MGSHISSHYLPRAGIFDAHEDLLVDLAEAASQGRFCPTSIDISLFSLQLDDVERTWPALLQWLSKCPSLHTLHLEVQVEDPSSPATKDLVKRLGSSLARHAPASLRQLCLGGTLTGIESDALLWASFFSTLQDYALARSLRQINFAFYVNRTATGADDIKSMDEIVNAIVDVADEPCVLLSVCDQRNLLFQDDLSSIAPKPSALIIKQSISARCHVCSQAGPNGWVMKSHMAKNSADNASEHSELSGFIP